jgi:hypothetical protein
MHLFWYFSKPVAGRITFLSGKGSTRRDSTIYCNAILLLLVPAPVKLIVASQAAAKPRPLDADLQTGPVLQNIIKSFAGAGRLSGGIAGRVKQ